jgi:hypothetical protein
MDGVIGLVVKKQQLITQARRVQGGKNVIVDFVHDIGFFVSFGWCVLGLVSSK